MTPIPTVPGGYGALLVDPPWHFQTYGDQTNAASYVGGHYETMGREEIKALPVGEVAADDSVIFLWVTWPTLEQAMSLISAWGFTYKTCAFSWMKAHASQLEMFRDDNDVQVGLGYWTRANSEVCLLATRGKPKRLNADVRQGIIEPRREHSRKPDCVHARIERLVAGPYLELFARNTPRPGWTAWGNEVGKYGEVSHDR